LKLTAKGIYNAVISAKKREEEKVRKEEGKKVKR
jgi:hypothetical protein